MNTQVCITVLGPFFEDHWDSFLEELMLTLSNPIAFDLFCCIKFACNQCTRLDVN